MASYPHLNLAQAEQRQRFVLFAGAYVLVWLLTWYSAQVFETLGVVSLWYLPAGLRFFCLFFLGWLGLALEVFTSVVLLVLQFFLADARPAAASTLAFLFEQLYNALAFPCAYALVVLPLRWRLGAVLDFARAEHGVLFVGAALLASSLSAAAGVAGLVYHGTIAPSQASEVLTSWMTGDFIGAITLAPLLLVLLLPRVRHFIKRGGWRPAHQQPGRMGFGRMALLTALMVLTALVLVLGVPRLLGVNHQSPTVALLLLLPLAAVTLRFNLRGAVLAILLLDSGLVLLVALLSQREWALQYQLEMISIALVGIWLGGAVEARNQLVLQLRDFSSVSNDLLWEVDRDGVLSIKGRLANQIVFAPGSDWRSLLEPVAQPQMAALEQALGQRQAFANLQFSLVSGMQTPRWMSFNGTPLWDESGEYVGYRGTASDISDAVKVKALMESYNQQLVQEVAQRTAELHRMNAELVFKEQHVRILLAAAPVGVLELDEGGHCHYLNATCSALSGRSLEQAQGMHLLDFVDAQDRERVALAWNERQHLEAAQSLEFRLSPSQTWCAAYWIKFQQAQDQGARTIVILADSTQQHQQAERLWAMAHTDVLTGLPNRNLFMDRCTQTLTMARRREMGAAVLWIDLDGFKAVNDSLGHAAGDVLLQQVAQRLKSRVRDSDTVARIGGDEFAVVMADLDSAQAAEQVAQELVQSLRTAFDLPQGVVHISASIGIALYPLHAESVEALMRFADIAMYGAKHAGKDQLLVWSEGLPVPGDSASGFAALSGLSPAAS